MITIKKIFIFFLFFSYLTTYSYAADITKKSDLIGKCFTYTKYENNKVKSTTTLCFKASCLSSFNKSFARLENGNTLIDAAVALYGNWRIIKNTIYIKSTENIELGSCHIQYKNKNIFFKKCTDQLEFFNNKEWAFDINGV